MNIKVERIDNCAILYIEGEIDSITSKDLEEEINVIMDNGVKKIILGFERVTYISSAGIRVVFMTLQKMLKTGGSLAIAGSTPDVKEILEIVGLQNFVNFYKDITDAKKSFFGEC